MPSPETIAGGQAQPWAANLVFKHSPIHGLGGFALVDLPPGSRIIEYVGETITKLESKFRCSQHNEFIFWLDDEHDIDGGVEWNQARWLNHSCQPNAEAVLIEGRIWIMALRPIKAGEEVTFNYGYDLEDFQEHPCHCLATPCVGYILAEEFWDQIQPDPAARKSMERARPANPVTLATL